MTTFIYSHPACLGHDPGPFVGMGPARVEAVVQALQGPSFEPLEWRSSEPVSVDHLAMVHTIDYIAEILQPIVSGEQRDFGLGAVAMSDTASAALHAAGLVEAAIRAVVAGEARNAFCIVSPGGHHAEADTAQGFCFFNHVAFGAVLAQRLLHIERVAVLDFDAHHGNGTQSLFWNYRDRMLVSLHEDMGLSGFVAEQGAHGTIVNIPLPTGSGGAAFRRATDDTALPAIAAFRPDLLLVSAGFDMHRGDPLAGVNLEIEDYAWTGERLATFAKSYCRGKMIAVLEGGYNLEFLGPCAAAFVGGMMKDAASG